MTEKPERAIVFELKVEADDVDSLVKALYDLARVIQIDGLMLNSVSGGYSWSHVYTSRQNEITHEEYFEKINNMLGKND